MTLPNNANRSNKSEKIILWLSFIVLVYFTGIIAIDLAKLDWVIIGVVREILTIPFLLLLLGLAIVSTLSLFRKKQKIGSLPFYSILILLATIIMLSLAS